MWRFLGSARLALALLLLMAAFFGGAAVAGVKALGNPFFLGLVAAFAANTFACTLRRAARLLREARKQAEETGPAAGLPADRRLRAAATLLGARGYRVEARADYLLAEKHRFAAWGPVILHAGFLAVLAGAVLSLGFRTEGQFGVVEGQSFTSPGSRYVSLRKGAWVAAPPGFSVYLKHLNVSEYTEGAVISGELYFLEKGQPVRRAVVETGKPVNYGGLTFYEKIFGYTVGIILRDLRTGRVYPVRASLDTVLHRDGEEYKGQFEVPGGRLTVWAEFFPTVGGTAEVPRMASYEPRDPAVFLRIYEYRSDRIAPLYKGVVRLGRNVRAGDYEIRFDHYLRWLGLTVVRDPGRPVVYTGFAVIMAGLVLTYLVFPKRLRVTVSESGIITVRGWSPRFGHLVAEETGRIEREIQDWLNRMGRAHGA